MPPKRGFVDPMSMAGGAGDSDDDNMANMMGGGAPGFDPSRFTNPNYSREFLATLPGQIRKRVNALLGMDKKYVELKKDYEAKRNELMRKFEVEEATPLYQARKAIIAGDAAVNDDEVNAGIPEEHKAAEIDTASPASPNNKEDNLSGFWLKALQRHVIINDMITDKDAEILKYLTDISCISLEAPANGFTVRFEFAANDSFKNTVLSKTFHLKEIFDELTVERVEGTKIEWSSNEKNVTIEVVKKKQKAKVKGKVVHRTIEKTQPCDSFFRFFNEGPVAGEGGEEREDEDEGEQFEEMDEDQWLGLAHVLRDKIVPYAVEYFTGEAPDGSSDLEDDDEFDGEEGEEEEEEDEDEPPMMPAGGRGRGGAGGAGGAPRGKQAGGAGAGGRGGGAQPGGKMAGGQQECKQQ